MSGARDWLNRMRAGRPVELRESYLHFLATRTLPASMVLVAGLLLGALQGGLWWALAGFGAVILAGQMIWGLLRTTPRVTVDEQGVTCGDRFFEWHQIETFGADSAEYVPDWVYIRDSNGEHHELGSTFGWKNVALRDALNDLLCELRESASEPHDTAVASRGPKDESRAAVGAITKFRKPTGSDDAIRQARELLARYYHPDCGTVTEIDDRVLVTVALDPDFFPNNSASCDGCGSARTRDLLLDNGQTLHEVLVQMRRAVPLKASLGKFFLFALVLGPLGAAVGLSIPVPRNGWLLGVLGAGGGFLLGILLSMLLYRPLRRRGWMW